MNFEGKPGPKTEAPQRLVERMQTIIDSYPRLLFKRGELYEEATPETPIGSIGDMRGKGDDRPVCVPTNKGAIVEAGREIGTDRMWGCATILIRHPNGKLLAHLTPTDRLAYMDHDLTKDESNEATAQKVIEILEQAGIPLSECRGTIVGNIGNKGGKYDRDRQLKIWQHLGERLQGSGLAHWQVIEVPMDETLVFHTPDKPNKVFVMGHPAKLNEHGSLDVNQRDVDSRWIELE